MELPPTGHSTAFVVRVQAAVDGTWYLYLEGTCLSEAIRLVPATLIMQIWLTGDTSLLRASIRLHGSEHRALIQGNMQLMELLRAWLLNDDTKAGIQ